MRLLSGIALLGLVLLAGCVEQKPVPADNGLLGRASVVAVGVPGFALEAGDALAWQQDLLLVKDPSTAAPNLSRDQMTRIIENELTRRGVAMAAGQQQARYRLVAAVVLGDSAEGQEVMELAKLFPSLAGTEGRDVGTLLVGIRHLHNDRLLWRGAVEIVLTPEISGEEAQLRAKATAAMLLSSLPLASAQ